MTRGGKREKLRLFANKLFLRSSASVNDAGSGQSIADATVFAGSTSHKLRSSSVPNLTLGPEATMGHLPNSGQSSTHQVVVAKGSWVSENDTKPDPKTDEDKLSPIVTSPKASTAVQGGCSTTEVASRSAKNQPPPPIVIIPPTSTAPLIISPPASYAGSLWKEAFATLSEADRQAFSLQNSDYHAVIQETLKSTREQKEICEQKQRNFIWRGEEYRSSDIVDKLISWAETFIEVGDTIVQYDPVHSALPWAGVRFILHVRTEFLTSSAVEISSLILIPIGCGQP